MEEEKFKIEWVVYEEIGVTVVNPYLASRIVFADDVWESNGYLVHGGKDYLIKDREVKRI